jgi:hypothetical protein
LGQDTGLESDKKGGKASSGDSPFLRQALDDAWGPKAAAGTESAIARLETSKLLLASPGSRSDAAEIMDGLIDGAVYRPGRAIGQMLGVAEASRTAPTNESSGRKTGQVVGSLIPFVGLVGLTRGASAQILGEVGQAPLYRLLGEQAAAGFLYGSLFTPSHLKPGQGLLEARLNQGSISAATYASMTGTQAVLDRDLPRPEDADGIIPGLARRLSISVLSGAVGQFVDAQGRTSFGAKVPESLSSSFSTLTINTLAERVDKVVDHLIEPEAAGLKSRIIDAAAAGADNKKADTPAEDRQVDLPVKK